MILTEQLYQNYNRPYFIGYDRKSKIKFEGLRFLTTNPLYAFFYSGKKGYISEYRLKQGLNIFNARSIKDFNLLHNYILKNNLNYSYDILERLKSEDWVFVLEGDSKRQVLLDILIKLGFDGFFNFEYDSKMQEELKLNYSGFKLPIESNNPAIGVFNRNLEDLFKEVQTFRGLRDFLKLPGFLKLKQAEIFKLKSTFRELVKFLSKDKTLEVLRNQNWITLNSDEIELSLEEVLQEQLKPIPKWLLERQGGYKWQKE